MSAAKIPAEKSEMSNDNLDNIDDLRFLLAAAAAMFLDMNRQEAENARREAR